MINEGRDEREGMDARDDQALWIWLGRQEPPAKVSPYFARRVLREVSLAEEPRAVRWWQSLRNVWPSGTFARRTALGSGLLSGACAALLLVVTHTGRTRRNRRVYRCHGRRWSPGPSQICPPLRPRRPRR